MGSQAQTAARKVADSGFSFTHGALGKTTMEQETNCIFCLHTENMVDTQVK